LRPVAKATGSHGRDYLPRSLLPLLRRPPSQRAALAGAGHPLAPRERTDPMPRRSFLPQRDGASRRPPKATGTSWAGGKRRGRRERRGRRCPDQRKIVGRPSGVAVGGGGVGNAGRREGARKVRSSTCFPGHRLSTEESYTLLHIYEILLIIQYRSEAIHASSRERR
jgi:hypothetical protein